MFRDSVLFSILKMNINKDHNNLLEFENLKVFKSLSHFSTTIIGGISDGNYESFNLGIYSGDKIENVLENRSQLTSALNIDSKNIYLPYQIHKDKIGIVDDSFLSKSEDEKTDILNGIDAIITNKKDICIGVTTADCVPILIFDPTNNVLAAVHAGWRGTTAKIIVKTITKMQEGYSSKSDELIVGIAPSITQKYFEVGEEVVNEFIEAGFPVNDIGYRDSISKKMHLDLQTANKFLMLEAGVLAQNIEISGLCTYSSPQLFFSARRQTINSGRMVTGGVLR